MTKADAKKLIFDAIVDNTSSQYYGSLKVFNILGSDQAPVTIDSVLFVTLKAPAKVSDVKLSTNPYVDASITTSSEQIDANLYAVTIKIELAKSHQFDLYDTVSIGVDGDLLSDRDFFIQSIAVYADALPPTSAWSSSSGVLTWRRLSARQPAALAQLGNQPTTFTNYIGAMIRNVFGCCMGREDSLNEKLPGEIRLKN